MSEDLLELERSLVELTRAADDLLAALRSGTLVPDAGVTASLVSLVAASRDVLGHVQTGAEAGALGSAPPYEAAGNAEQLPAPAPRPAEDHPRAALADDGRLLLATWAGGAQLAVPLAAVRRLEQFTSEQVQRGGDLGEIRYGDAILRLVWVADLLSDLRPGRGHPRTPDAPTIVCDSSAGSIGLVVDRIEDVVPQPHVALEPSGRPGVAGRLVIDGRVTELVDIEALVAAARTRGQLAI